MEKEDNTVDDQAEDTEEEQEETDVNARTDTSNEHVYNNWLAQKETDHFTTDEETDNDSHSAHSNDTDNIDRKTLASPRPLLGGEAPPPRAPMGQGSPG